MKQYLDLLKTILDNGTLKHNRTGIDTISYPCQFLRHDMRTGFPLLTTKKMGLKNICSELEMFIHGITDKQFLLDRKNGIWTAWCNPKKVPYGHDEETQKRMAEEKDLSKIYGYQWNCFEGDNKHIIEIMPKIIPENKPVTYPLFPLEQTDGIVYENNNGDKFVVLDVYNIDGKKLAKIQFLHTGYIKKDVRFDMGVIHGNVKDPYEPSYLNIGYTGNQEDIDTFIGRYGEKIYKRIQKIWNHMLDRCYNPKCNIYQYYGAKNIFVDSRWFDFSVFLRDIQVLTNWPAFLREPDQFELDKDYYASNAYSKDSCIWLSAADNALYRKDLFKPFYAINEKTGERTLFISQTDCIKKLGIPKKITAVLNGTRPHTGGYKFEYNNSGKLYRYALPVNQLKNAIETLKSNPTDRRMLVSAWNPLQLDEMALPPCHFCFQLISDGEYVDLLWSQRSADWFLGVAFDLASYAMLLTLICHQVKMKPRFLAASFGDAHIYVNHLEQVKEQLSREPYKLPTVKILNADDPNWTIWDWKYTDFELVNYQCHPAIKAPIAV